MPTLPEDRTLRLLFIGHSHMRCVRDAAAATQTELASRQIHVDTLLLQQPAFDAGVAADAPVPPVLAAGDWPALQARAAQADVVVPALGGNAHVVFGLVELWRLHSHLVAADCADHGMALLPVPAACNDAGYLAQPALADDPTHAGPWYGRRVIEQLVRRHRPGFAFG